MPTVIENLNSIITTKNEIAGILSENGVDAGNVFSNYPSYIRSVIASGGGGEVTYAYLADQLTYYVQNSALQSMSYATKSYVVDYVAEHGGSVDLSAYVTKVELSAQSYATQSYVADYVATYAPTPDLSAYVTKTELNNAGYISSIPNTYPTYTAISNMSYATKTEVNSIISYNSSTGVLTITTLS